MIFKYKHRLLGAHVHVDVFIGENPYALGKAGTLVMRLDEWKKFAAIQHLPRHVNVPPAEMLIIFEDTAAYVPASAGPDDLVRLLDVNGDVE